MRRFILDCTVSAKWVSHQRLTITVAFHDEGSRLVEASLAKQRRRTLKGRDSYSTKNRERLSFCEQHTDRVH